MNQSAWTEIRRLLWNDEEQILIVDDWRHTKPMKMAGKITIQPKAQFCCGNSFRPSSSRRKDNVHRFHTWVIEFDDMPIDEQRKMWEQSDMPHTLRVFSGNKSVHVYIRCAEDVDADTWQEIANNLKRIFPEADNRVLTDRCRLSRLPGGFRGNICQKIETTKSRVTLQLLTEWIEKQDVIQRYRYTEIQYTVIQKNIYDDTPSIPDKIKSMVAARQEFAANFPEQERYYRRIVEPRFEAEAGKRNERLIELITFLHDSVSESVAMIFAEMYYRLNALCFNDPLEQHIAEARSHWKVLDSDYAARLSRHEREIYSCITDRERTFFRICRSLAHGDKPEGARLFIPMTKFGHRMGLKAVQIGRLIRQFKVYGLIRTIEKGTQHRIAKDGAVEHGTAGEYEWIPAMDINIKNT